MNLLFLLPLIFLTVPIIPPLLEIFRRRDKGPRKIPEETIHEEKPDISKPLPTMERARASARMRATDEIIRAMGDVSIPDETEIEEHIVVYGFLKVGQKCHIHGSIKAFGGVEIGAESVVEGHILSEGKVIIGPKTKVNGIIDSVEDIILKEDATVEAVSTEKSVKIGLGAKINRRILAGASIHTAPSQTTPLEGGVPKETLPEFIIIERMKNQPEESYREAPPPTSIFEGLFKAEEKRIEEATSGLFKHLEDQIRKLDEVDKKMLHEAELGELTPIESKVLMLLSSGSDVDEIGLRLLMDPVHVRKVIHSLIEKNYLDKDLKPILYKINEGPLEEVREGKMPSPSEKKGDEEPATQTPRKDEISVEEFFERLLASKLRDEVKKKLEGNRPVKKIDDSSVALEDWRKTSSVLYEEKRDEYSQRPISDAKPEFKKLWEILKGTSKRSLKMVTFRHVIPSSVMTLGTIFLPILALFNFLLAEVAFYKPISLPINLRSWPVFLVLAIGLGFLSIICVRECSKPREGLEPKLKGG